MSRPFHWTDGNGALPFPGKRVEIAIPGPFATMKTYEIHEYLGNETVTSYRLIFHEKIPESTVWPILEREFLYYVLGEDNDPT